MAQIYLAHRALDGVSGHAMGRQLLQELYAAHAGGAMPQILQAPLGKPYFAHSPWHFSISHTKRHAFCVLADRPVGIDAEEMDRKVPMQIMQKILSPEEWTQVEAAPDRDLAFLQIWVLKEATAKQSGEGIRIHPKYTHFTLPDPRVQRIDGCVMAIVAED